MVTHGFLSPEALAEAHRVGETQLQLSGDEATIRAKAAGAVERRREDRAARKAAKKRQAEERRKARAAAVAERRANDIVFLGRGVSSGLANRTSDIGTLQKRGLPILSTPADVAKAIGVTIPQLRWLAFHSEAATSTHYRRWQIPKKSGGMREISAPMAKLAAAQRWIFDQVLSKLPPDGVAHGFVRGRSTVTNATPHVKRGVVVNLDLRDFFPSIVFPRVRGLFEWMGYSPAAATILALLCTESPRRAAAYEGKAYHVAIGPRGLPQGACTSPAISNLIAWTLDRRLAGLQWTYTRYADDLTFSGDDPQAVAWLLARVRHILEEEGFEVNEKKLRVQRRSAQQSVTGIVVNEKLSVPRRERRRLRAMKHQGKLGKGHVAYVRMVNAEQGDRLA
jgi:retron-type reverse transcriptase